MAAKRARSRLVQAFSHCSRVDDAVWQPNGWLEGFMLTRQAADHLDAILSGEQIE